MYLGFSILCTIVSSCFIFVTLRYNKTNDRETAYVIGLKRYNIILLFIMMLSAILYLFRLDQIPYGTHVDEIFTAYDSFCMANWGISRWGNSYPVYLTHTSGGQSVLLMYMVSILYKLFGSYSVYLLRLPVAIIAIIQIYFTAEIVREMKNENAGLITTILMLIYPYFIMRARFALDCNMMLSLSIISLYCIVKALKYKNTIFYFFSGVFLGITLYTYALAYMVIPMFLILLLVYLVLTNKSEVNIKNILLLIIPLGIIAFPLVIMVVINTFNLETVHIWKITIPNMPGYRGAEITLKGIIKNLKMPYTLLIGDKITYNSVKPYCTMYIMSIPFVIFGFIKSFIKFIIKIKEREFCLESIIILFFTAEVIMGLLQGPGININKLNASYFALVFFACVGIMEVYRKVKMKYMLIICIMFMFNFGCFAKFYYIDYKSDIYPQWNFDYDIGKILTNESTQNTSKNIYTNTPYIDYFFENKINPDEFFVKSRLDDVTERPTYKNIHFYIPKNIDNNGVYIIRKSDNELKNLFSDDWSCSQINCYEIYKLKD